MNPSIQIWEIKNDGLPVPLALPADSLDDVSRQLPQGLYSTFRTLAGRTRALDLRHHLERLYQPAARMDIRPVVEEAGLRRALAELLSARGRGDTDEARVRVSLSTESTTAGALFIAIEPLHAIPDEHYRRGVRVVTLRQAARANPGLKSTAFIGQSAQARQALAASGAFEGLILHHERILEGLTSNFYTIKDGLLRTAGRGVLPGVTRRLALALARAEGIPVSYRALRLNELARIDEAFLTSSSRGVLPVVQVDDMSVGRGVPGPITRRLMVLYDAYVEQQAGLIRPG